MKSLVCLIVFQFCCSNAFALMSFKEALEVRNWASRKTIVEIKSNERPRIEEARKVIRMNSGVEKSGDNRCCRKQSMGGGGPINRYYCTPTSGKECTMAGDMCSGWSLDC